MVDALDSKSSVLNRRAGSIPALGTKKSKDNPLGQMIERVFLLWGAEEYLFVLFLF